jgi:Flp pilus assembly protein TadG
MAWKLGNLWRDNRGAAMIETAILVPVLGMLACGVADVSLGFRQKLNAQQAADRAVQFAINAGLTTATQTMIQTEAATGAGLPAANVTVSLWLECNAVVQSNFNGTCASGTPARYVSVTVADTYTPQYGRLLSIGTIALQGFAEGRIQ